MDANAIACDDTGVTACNAGFRPIGRVCKALTINARWDGVSIGLGLQGSHIPNTPTAALCTIGCNRIGSTMMNWSGGWCDCWRLPSGSSSFTPNLQAAWQVGGYGPCASFNRLGSAGGQCWESFVDPDDGYCVRVDNGQPCS